MKKVFALVMAIVMVAAMFAGCGNNAKGMTIEEGKLANLVFVDDVFNVKKVILGGKVWAQ